MDILTSLTGFPGCFACAVIIVLAEIGWTYYRLSKKPSGLTEHLQYLSDQMKVKVRFVDDVQSYAFPVPFGECYVALTPLASDFTVYRELVHIKQRHMWVRWVVDVLQITVILMAFEYHYWYITGIAMWVNGQYLQLKILRWQEKMADLEAVNHVSRKSLAGIIQSYATDPINVLLEKYGWLQMFISIPMGQNRSQYMVESYYHKLWEDMYPLTVNGENIPLTLSRTIFQMIFASTRKNMLIGLEKITILPHTGQDYILFDTGQQHVRTYTICPETTDRYLQTSDGENLLAIVEKVLASPLFREYILESKSKNGREWDMDNDRDILLKQIAENTTQFDMATAQIWKDEAGDVHVKVFEP